MILNIRAYFLAPDRLHDVPACCPEQYRIEDCGPASYPKPAHAGPSLNSTVGTFYPPAHAVLCTELIGLLIAPAFSQPKGLEGKLNDAIVASSLYRAIAALLA